MIVIAAHNDKTSLDNILSDLTECDLCGHAVLVVDTNSDDSSFKEHFSSLRETYPHFKFDRKDYSCWDSGAYIHAYNNYEDDKYIFLQDSLRIKNPNAFREITTRLDYTDVLGLFNFFYCYDSIEQQEWVEESISFTDLPKFGIFGPIFSARKDALDKIPKDWLKSPSNKMQGCGMERRWALMFQSLNLRVNYLSLFGSNEEWRYHESLEYQTDYCLHYFSKQFKHRL